MQWIIKTIGIIICGLVLLITTACQKEIPYKTVESDRSRKKLPIPMPLWQKIQSIEIETGEKARDLPVKFFGSKAFLTNKMGTPLHGGENLAIDFSGEGGVIDLSSWITDLGSFRIRFEVEKGISRKALRVYFLSHAKTRRSHRHQYGAGCQVFMDLTETFREVMGEGQGWTVSSVDGRHISVLGGYFLMAGAFDGHLHLSYAGFTDSRYHNWLCHEDTSTS